MWWRKFDGSQIQGTRISGDPAAPPTTWLNFLWLWSFGWKLFKIFIVPPEAARAGYRIGYKAHDGTTRLSSAVQRTQRIAVRVGREDCIFFAVGPDGQEIRLDGDQYVNKAHLKRYGIPFV